MSQSSLLTGNIAKGMLSFAFPLMLGNLLQQCYNLADTFIVGRFIGAGALAAVGAAYALMVFLNSVQFGLCLGSSALFSIHFGSGNTEKLRRNIYVAFMLIAGVTAVLNVAVFLLIDPLMRLLQVPAEVYAPMREYLWIVFFGLGFTFLYNFAASLLRAVGDAVTPLWFLAGSVVLNIGLDLLFILTFDWGIEGAAAATVVSQGLSAVGLSVWLWVCRPELRVRRADAVFDRVTLHEITSFSFLTCVQQSVMNFGILLVQGLVNSFGTVVMAAFAAAVKIDSFAYMPVQEFGNAFSTFIAQNFGAQKHERICRGVRSAFVTSVVFSLAVSVLVFVFARPLMLVFVRPEETEILRVGVEYLRIEGAFYPGIGILFLLYGYYRAVRMPGMSVVLTVLSLGVRVALSYWLASTFVGVSGIWWSIPIGWALADVVGIFCYYRMKITAPICHRRERSYESYL